MHLAVLVLQTSSSTNGSGTGARQQPRPVRGPRRASSRQAAGAHRAPAPTDGEHRRPGFDVIAPAAGALTGVHRTVPGRPFTRPGPPASRPQPAPAPPDRCGAPGAARSAAAPRTRPPSRPGSSGPGSPASIRDLPWQARPHQHRLDRARPDRRGPARTRPVDAPDRRARPAPRRTQDAALPAAPHRRPHHPRPTQGLPAPGRALVLGSRARQSLRTAAAQPELRRSQDPRQQSPRSSRSVRSPTERPGRRRGRLAASRGCAPSTVQRTVADGSGA